MRYLVIGLLLVSGCATAKFTPSTQEGAQCKQDCNKALMNCNAHMITCNKGYSACLDTCADAEQIIKAPKP